MKKYLIAILALTIISFGAKAQTPDNSTQSTPSQHNNWKMHQHGRQGYGRFHHRGYFIMKDLNLTDVQKKQMKALNEDYNNKIRNLEKDDNITLKDYRAQKANLQNERKTKFLDILTVDQKNKIAQAKKARSEKMQMMAQKRLEKMKTELNLSESQVAKLQAQRKNSMQQMKAIRESSTLSSDQKREQMMDLHKQDRESMKSILTADQYKKMEEMRSNRMNYWKNKKTVKQS